MTDTLTDDGIKSDHPMATMADYRDLHGEPVHEGDNRIVFADGHGYELDEWADALDMDLGELSERMHELAREVYGRAESDGPGDPWSAVDPVVFDAATFDRD